MQSVIFAPGKEGVCGALGGKLENIDNVANLYRSFRLVTPVARNSDMRRHRNPNRRNGMTTVTSGGTVGSAATTQGVKQGSVVVPSARARAKEARLEGLAAVRAEAERLRVMTETLGYPTPLGNLKLKFDVHVRVERGCVTVVRCVVDAGGGLGSEEVDVNM